MCEEMSVYAGEKRDEVNILRLCCGCGVCGVCACCGCGVCGVFAAVLPRQYLHGHVLFCEEGVVLGWGVSARPQQGHEAACHHVRVALYGDVARKGGSRAVQRGFPLLGTEGDLSRPLLCGDPPGPLSPFGKAVHRPAKALIAAADGKQRFQGGR